MWNKIYDPNQSQCYGGGSEELRAQSVTELSPGHWDPGHLTPPTQVPVASPTSPSPGRHQYPKEFPPHPSPTPREERGLTRLFIVAGVLPRHLMEKLQSRNQRMYAQEGANQPWVPTHMETVLSYLVQLLGLPWPPAGSACLPDCIVRALSLPMKLCRATPGAKPNSSHLQELTSSLLSSWSGAGLPKVLTFSSLSAGTVFCQLQSSGVPLFSSEHQTVPTPITAFCLQDSSLPTTGAFRLQNTPSGFFCDVFGLCCSVWFSVLNWVTFC